MLQEHLVRTAYALHFTAADLAAQHERRAGLRMLPSGIDHRLQAKRWTGLSDFALDIVRRWDSSSGELDEHPSVSVAAPAHRQPQPEDIQEMAYGVIERLFRVGSTLQTTMPVVDALAQDGLNESAKELDEAMLTMRTIIDGVRGLSVTGEGSDDIG